MEYTRTPDHRFDNLVGWDHEPSYLVVTAADEPTELRMAYVDTGPRNGRCVMLLHGEPTWGYLYRKMIGPLVAHGCRVVVPDLVGFGRSDKPTAKSDYTYARHVDWVSDLVEQLDLTDAVFFGQDWGSLIGLAVVARHEQRFDAVMIANGGLPDPDRRDDMLAALATSADPGAFIAWQSYAAALESIDVGAELRKGLGGHPGLGMDLTEDEAAAYNAPFPEASFQSGALVFPALASNHGAEGQPFGSFAAAWQVLERWDKPFLCRFGTADPVLGWFDQHLISRIPGTAEQPHQRIEGGRHFIQEDYPEELVDGIRHLLSVTS